MSTLSVCLITKNEELNIKRCINSIKHIADEIVIVDTGSTDNTVNIAKKLGAIIHFHKWENDFSIARNQALSYCTKEWILMLDADESISAYDGKRLKSILDDNQNLDGVYLRLCNLIDNTVINETSSLRVFKNSPIHRYTGRLHEQIYFSITENNPDAKLVTTDIVLNHYGYDHNIVDMNKKIERNIFVLEGSPDKDKDGFFYFNLATEYSKLGNIEKARENFELSMATPSKDYGFKPYLAISFCKTLSSLNEFSTSLKYLDEFFVEMNDFKDLYFLQALCYHSIYKYSFAMQSMLNYISTKSNYTKYPNFNIENQNDISGITYWLAQNSSAYKKGTLTIFINPSNPLEDYSKTLECCNDLCDEILVLKSSILTDKLEFGITEIANISSYGITTDWLLELNSPFEPNLSTKKIIINSLSQNKTDFNVNSLKFIKL